MVEATAVDGLLFRGNTIRLTDYAQQVTDEAPSFALRSGRHIVIENNTFEGTQPLTIESGTPSAKPLLRGNRGIILQ